MKTATKTADTGYCPRPEHPLDQNQALLQAQEEIFQLKKVLAAQREKIDTLVQEKKTDQEKRVTNNRWEMHHLLTTVRMQKDLIEKIAHGEIEPAALLVDNGSSFEMIELDKEDPQEQVALDREAKLKKQLLTLQNLYTEERDRLNKIISDQRNQAMADEQPSKANSHREMTRKQKAFRLYKTLLNAGFKMAENESPEQILREAAKVTAMEIDVLFYNIYMNDSRSEELICHEQEIHLATDYRIGNREGIVGYVFSTGQPLIIHDPAANNRFNPEQYYRYGTKINNICCAPINTIHGEVIGVVELINKRKEPFTETDQLLVEATFAQASIILQTAIHLGEICDTQKQERAFFELFSDIASELELKPLLTKVMNGATKILNAERSTLLLNDKKSNELWSVVAEGMQMLDIRFPNHKGIAGAVFQTGRSTNIPFAYADLRFNPDIDVQSGFFTRSILCVPVVSKNNEIIGVTQILNKVGGFFTAEDEARLRVFNSQISIALENSQLFNDIQNMKNYNQSMLESMSNGIITLDEHGTFLTINGATSRILACRKTDIVGKSAKDIFVDSAVWIFEKIQMVQKSKNTEIAFDVELIIGRVKRSVNLTILPLLSVEGYHMGSMVIIEDISAEKRARSTMARYLDPLVIDKLMNESDGSLGGKDVLATVLFSDIRSFTSMTERLGPQQTVKLLNDYFTMMVDCIQQEGGVLDKFIGDAIMAVFGSPLRHEDDEDRSVRAAIAMLQNLALFNQDRLARDLRPIEMGIGLNTDIVVSGNIGSPKRMDFTLIGDGVNLASRLETACKQYHTQILISMFTRQRLTGNYRMRAVDWVIVKGKSEPVQIFEVMDHHTEETFPNFHDTMGYFNNGMHLYQSKNWQSAGKYFRKALKSNPKDRVSELYLDLGCPNRALAVDRFLDRIPLNHRSCVYAAASAG